MKKIVTFLCSAVLCTTLIGQSSVLSFDGVDDYVDLGDSVANGVRTVELWFQPKVVIDSTINDFRYLVIREIATVNHNEFHISFQKSSLTNAGKLQFMIRDANNNDYRVFSDSNRWNVSQWYHVAAVVDSIKGMMLFIDGVKQVDTNSSIIAITSVKNSTTIGGTPVLSNRYFHGNIDDVRFSTSAEYSSNFTPSCSDLKSSPLTVGLWNFNDSSNSVTAIDSSGKMNNATIHGAISDTSSICKGLNTSIADNDLTKESTILIYPNPSKGKFQIHLKNSNNIERLFIYNSLGQILLDQKVNDRVTVVNIEDQLDGLYFYKVLTNGNIINSGKLFKK